jgi:hypothetical protein
MRVNSWQAPWVTERENLMTGTVMRFRRISLPFKKTAIIALIVSVVQLF